MDSCKCRGIDFGRKLLLAGTSTNKSVTVGYILVLEVYSLFQKFFEKPVLVHTAQKMKFPIKDFLSKCDQNRGFGHIY